MQLLDDVLAIFCLCKMAFWMKNCKQYQNVWKKHVFPYMKHFQNNLVSHKYSRKCCYPGKDTILSDITQVAS